MASKKSPRKPGNASRAAHPRQPAQTKDSGGFLDHQSKITIALALALVAGAGKYFYDKGTTDTRLSHLEASDKEARAKDRLATIETKLDLLMSAMGVTIKAPNVASNTNP